MLVCVVMVITVWSSEEGKYASHISAAGEETAICRESHSNTT